MFAILLRFFYILLPIGLGAWFMMDNVGFHKALDCANSWQGPSGLVVINQMSDRTVGTKVEKWLMAKFQTKDEGWLNVYRSAGYHIDVIVVSIENYWLWGGTALLLSGGILYLLGKKNYK